MFFLFRVAFWLGLLLLLLPLGLKGTNGSDVSVFDAFGAVQAVVADARGFCARQPDACAVGGQMATHLTEKAQVGAKWLYDTIGAKDAEASRPDAPVDATRPAHDPAPDPARAAAPAGTTGALELTPQDLAPVWGGGDKGQAVGPAPHAPPAPARRPS